MTSVSFDPANLPFPGSLPEFQRMFPNDAACAAYLEAIRWRQGFVCMWCGERGEPFRIATRPHVLRCRKCLVALSTGETVPTPQHTKNAAKALRRAQRSVARKKRHSNRRRKANLRVARLSAHVANQRRDFSHKLSRTIVDRFSHIAFESLNIKGLAAGILAKSVHNAAWNQLVQHVSYKAASAGSIVVLVDPRGTSQTCPECSTIKRKTLAERMHRCECGCTLDRDVAAAMIVLRRARFPDGASGQAQSQRIAA